jgi:small subunit ribosomal protein S3
MSGSEKSAVKSLLSMHRTYAELDEYLEKALKEAGYAGVDIQKNPIGSRITVFVTRPGLAIGRRGTGIKDLTERVAAKFPLPNPQIAVSEVESPELNPRIMAARIAQIVARGTAFRRAANWTMNSIMAAGAAGVEIGVAGKLRSDRSHKEKYRMGVVPKSGEASKQVVREATTDVLMKLGLFGIQVKIAVKDAMPPMVEFIEEAPPAQPAAPAAQATPAAPAAVAVPVTPAVPAPKKEEAKPETPQQEAKPAKPKAERKPKGERAPKAKAEKPAKVEKEEKKPEEAQAVAPSEPAQEAQPTATPVATEAETEKVEQVAKSES